MKQHQGQEGSRDAVVETNGRASQTQVYSHDPAGEIQVHKVDDKTDRDKQVT